jgi:hypothetical protein
MLKLAQLDNQTQTILSKKAGTMCIADEVNSSLIKSILGQLVKTAKTTL